MKEIKYIKGDATNITPSKDIVKLLLHGCNDKGAWGKGFVKAISAKWDKPEKVYRNKTKHTIGEVTFVNVAQNLYVGNMITQTLGSSLPFSYEGFRKCLDIVLYSIKDKNCEIHMPMIGAGLGGASWEEVENIIIEILSVNNIPVTVYRFEDTKSKFYIPTNG